MRVGVRLRVVVVAAFMAVACAVAVVSAVSGVAVAGVTPAPAITLHASPSAPFSSQTVTLSGRVIGSAPGATVQLYKSPYPYTQSTLARTTPVSSSDGSFAFTVRPDRSTRYRAVLSGTSVSASLDLGVRAKTI